MPVRLSCPYCNTAFTLPAVPASHRTPCPRCGESVAVKPPADPQPGEPLPYPKMSANGEPVGPLPPHSDPAPPIARAFLPLVWIGLAIALIVAGVGAATLFLRTPPAPPTPLAPPKPPSTWPPAMVPGLAYLPADVNVVAAVQPRALRMYADRVKADPKELFAEAGVPPAVRTALDKIGLPFDRIDHAAAGLHLADDNPLPRLVLALTVVPPVDEAALLQSCKASRDPDKPGRYRADLGGWPVELTKPADGVFVFATRGSDLDGLSPNTGRGSTHLPADVRESMIKLSPASVAWTATGAAKWADKPAVKLGAELAKHPDWPKRLAGVKAAAAGVSLEPNPKLMLAVRGDEADLPELRQQLAGALGETATVGGEGEWVTSERAFGVKPAVTGTN